MRVLFFATRLAGTDGVSLEAHKMRQVLERRGCAVHYCAGELERHQPRGHLVPAMHFEDQAARALGERAFGPEPDRGLAADIAACAAALLGDLERVVATVGPDLLVVQNAWAIPMQLPLAVALGRLVEQTILPTLAHNHDYWWERERFADSQVAELLAQYFPFAGPRVVQLSINSAARRELRRRRQLDSLLLPNVLDFDREPPGLAGEEAAYHADFRETIGVAPDRPLLLQPTRVVPRKGVELAIDLCAALADLHPALVVTHEAGDEGTGYLEALRQHAARSGVDLRHVASRIADRRATAATGEKTYSLWDAYPHADLVTYPSLYEGFGNALLEAVWFRRPVLVNRYPVYVEDIAPKGFRLVEIDGATDAAAVEQVRLLLQRAPQSRAALRATVDHNHAVALEHYGFATLERVLGEALAAVGLAL